MEGRPGLRPNLLQRPPSHRLLIEVERLHAPLREELHGAKRPEREAPVRVHQLVREAGRVLGRPLAVGQRQREGRDSQPVYHRAI
mgnify:CR=1 FL=1